MTRPLGRVDMERQWRILDGFIQGLFFGDWAAFDYEIANAEDHLAGRLSVVAREFPNADPDLLAIFGQPAHEAEDALMGYVGSDGSWVPGYAGLSEREKDVVKRYAAGQGLAEIRDELQPKRRRGVPVLALKTVENYLVSGKAKLRGVFEGN